MTFLRTTLLIVLCYATVLSQAQVCGTYCPSAASNSILEWIGSITIGPLSNASGNNGGYVDFGDSLSATFVEGETYFYILDPDFNATTYSEEFDVYFDYNQDGDFDDPGEHIIDALPSSLPATGSFVVPDGITPGLTKLRVVMSDFTVDKCGFYTYGETEDYCVTLEAVTCDNTSEITGISSTVGPTDITLSWNPVPNSIGCLINGGPVPSLGFTIQRNGPAVGSITLPRSHVPPGTYNWLVRCACQTLPNLVATQASAVGIFTVPAARIAGVSEISATISPNPVDEQMTIALQLPESSEASIEVVDLLGKIHQTQQAELITGSNSVSMNVQSLAPGNYLLRVSLPSGDQIIERFIVR